MLRIDVLRFGAALEKFPEIATDSPRQIVVSLKLNLATSIPRFRHPATLILIYGP